MHQSKNITQDLLLCKKYHLLRVKTSLGQLPKFGLIFLKIWNLSRLIHLENNVKTSCYLANFPVGFRFICLPLFSNMVFSAPFSHIFYLYSCSSQPMYTRMLFSLCLCVVVWFTNFIWRIFDAFCYFFFCYMWNVFKWNWFVLATGMAENLTHMVFCQPFVIQTC